MGARPSAARTPGNPAGLSQTDPLFLLAGAATLGILASDGFGPGTWPLFLAAWAAATLAVFLPVSRRWNPAVFFLTVSLGFGLLHAMRQESKRARPGFAALASGLTLRISGEGMVLDSEDGGPDRPQRIRLRIRSLMGSRCPPFPVLCEVPPQLPRARPGAVVRFSGSLVAPRPASNPGGFDQRAWLWRQGLHAVLRPDPGGGWEDAGPDASGHLRGFCERAGDWMAAAITRDLEHEPLTRGLLEAMVLGRREGADPQAEDAFRLSGTLHVFAVSGLHVGIWALVMWSLLKPLGISRRQLPWILVPLLFGYAAVTGLQPSALRAAVMASAVLLAFVADRRPRLLNSLGVAALLILAWDSDQLFAPGFQLSFGVLLSLILLAPRLGGPLHRRLQPDPFLPRVLRHPWTEPWFGFLRRCADVAAVSLAASLGSLPFVWGHFGLATPVGVIANCLLVPASFLVLFCAVVSMAFTLAGLSGVSVLLNNANHGLLTAAVQLAGWFASLPGAQLDLPARLPQTAPAEVTLLHFSGGGHAAHLSVRGGGDWLIDAGNENEHFALLRPYLRREGVSRLAGAFVSHADARHLGGFPPLIAEIPLAQLAVPPWELTGGSFRSTAAAAAQAGIPLRTAAADTVLRDGVARLEVLYPPAGDDSAPAQADDRGLVLRLVSDPWVVLFLGDGGLITESWLLERSAPVACDVLVGGARDGDFGLLPEFLESASPSLLVLPEEGSLWSGPLPASISSIPVWRMRETGAVRILLGRQALEARGWAGGQRFRKQAR